MSSKTLEDIKLAEVLDRENQESDQFQDVVCAAIHGRHVDFRIFLRRCYQAELREEQVIRILLECWRFEQLNVQPSLLFYTNGAALRIQQNDDQLALKTSRVAVLYAMVYSSGVGIPRNDSLAWRYAELAMSMKCREGYLLAGIMAKANPVLSQKYFEEVKNIDPILRSIVDKDRHDIRQQDQNLLRNKKTLDEYVEIAFAQKNHTLMFRFGKKLIEMIRSIQQKIDSASLEQKYNSTPEKIKLIDLAGRLLTRSYLAHQQKGEQKRAEEADQALFDLYEFQKGIYERERKSDEEKPKPKTKPDPITDEEKRDAALAETILSDEHTAAIQLQYYYGIIDPNLYTHLVDTCENKDAILESILKDQVLSSRAKMRRVIELIGFNPNPLFPRHDECVENLGHLTHQAQLDCMALLSCVALEYQKEIVDELRQLTQFANYFEKQMKRDQVYAPVKKRAFNAYVKFITRLTDNCSAGFVIALRLLLGETPGSEKIVLSKKPETALRLYKLLSQHDFNFIFNNDPEISRTVLLITILEEVEPEARDNQLKTILERLQDARFDSIADKDLAAQLKSTQSKHSDAAKQDQTPDYDNKQNRVPKQIALEHLQNLVDFYGVLPFAKMPRLAHGVIWTQKLQFKWFQENRKFLDAVKKATELFQSPEYQPSTANIFSDTFGKTAQYMAQLEAANTLLIDCKCLIFDKIALAQRIERCLKGALAKPKPPCFALALMEVMGSDANRLIPKDRFDLEKAKKDNYGNPAQTFREFYSAFNGYYLYTDMISAKFTSRLAF
jgi:hypothetical protein